MFRVLTIRTTKQYALSISSFVRSCNAQKYNHHRSFVNLTLIGPPGSGKGTYGSLLIKRKNLQSQNIQQDENHAPFILSAGDVLREHVINNTDIGKKVSEFQRLGKLADDETVTDALLDALHPRLHTTDSSRHDKKSDLGFILDGFPRTIKQAENITTSMASSLSSWPAHLRVHYAVSIEVPYFVCEAKILGRRKCTKCGESFNVNGIDQDGFYMPPVFPECSCYDSTGHKDSEDNPNWSVREDDTKEIAKTRYDEFMIETAPVVQYYENIGKLIRFVPYRGTDDIHILEQLIKEKLESE